MEKEKIQQEVSRAIVLDRKIKSDTKELEKIKAGLQAEALYEMDNKNLKYIEYHSMEGICNIGYKEKLEITNFSALKQLLGDVATDKIKREESVKLTPEAKFKAALLTAYRGDYSQHHDIKQILLTLDLDPKQVKAASKKLKGDYWKDKKTLASFGITGDLEEELDAIRQTMNYELACKYLDLGNLDLEKFKKTISVEESLSIGLDYEND